MRRADWRTPIALDHVLHSCHASAWSPDQSFSLTAQGMAYSPLRCWVSTSLRYANVGPSLYGSPRVPRSLNRSTGLPLIKPARIITVVAFLGSPRNDHSAWN